MFYIQNHPGRNETARTVEFTAADGFIYPIRLEDGRVAKISERQLAALREERRRNG